MLYPEEGYGQFGLTVNPKGVSKWPEVETYCSLHGIAPEEVAAVDGLNDVEMLRRAAVRIGVQGRCEEVVELAES